MVAAFPAQWLCDIKPTHLSFKQNIYLIFKCIYNVKNSFYANVHVEYIPLTLNLLFCLNKSYHVLFLFSIYIFLQDVDIAELHKLSAWHHTKLLSTTWRVTYDLDKAKIENKKSLLKLLNVRIS